MADTTLTALTAASALDGAELYYSVQGAADRKVTGTQIKTWTSASPTLVTPVLGVATATSINGLTVTTSTGTLTVPNSVVLTGPASSGTAMTLGNTETVTGVKTFGSAGAVGRLKIAGTSSGAVTLDATAAAGTGTLTLPDATDTLVGKATTDTLTNKTFDTAGTGNSFSVNGTAITAKTGTGSVVLANTPTLITPDIGVATGTSLDVSGVIESGANSGTLGQVKLYGNTSGDVTLKPAAAAGTGTVFQFPANNGTNTYVLQTNGSGVTSWVALAGGGDMLTTNNLSDVANAATAFGNIKQAASESATGVVELATTAEATTGTDTTRAVTAAGLLAAVAGKHTIWIPASAMWARTTAGPGAASRELTTGGDIMIKGWAFDTTTEEGVQFYIAFPKSWDKGTITFQPFWTNVNGLTTETVSWGLSAGAFTDSDAIDSTDLGTEVRVADTWLAANDMHVSAESGAVTVGNTPIDDDMVIGQIVRSVSNDTMTGDAELLGCKIFYTTNAFTDD